MNQRNLFPNVHTSYGRVTLALCVFSLAAGVANGAAGQIVWFGVPSGFWQIGAFLVVHVLFSAVLATTLGLSLRQQQSDREASYYITVVTSWGALSYCIGGSISGIAVMLINGLEVFPIPLQFVITGAGILTGIVVGLGKQTQP